MNLRRKLIAGFTASAVVTLVVGLVSYQTFQRMGENAKTVDDIYLPATRQVMLADMMHDSLMGVAYRAIVVAERNDAKEQAAVRESLDECRTTFSQALTQLDSLKLPTAAQQAVAEVRPKLNDYVASATQVVETAFTNRAAAIASLPAFQESFEALEGAMGTLGDKIEANAKVSVDASHAVAATGTVVVGGGTVAGMLLALALGFGFSRSIFSRLTPLVDSLTQGSTQTAAAAGQVSKASQLLAEGASAQAASLEETSASLEELSSMATRNAENTVSAKSLGQEARVVAEAGTNSIHEMGEAISGIQTSGQEMSAAVDAISASSREVAKIVRTIDEIAFQTNILALNAAVEAARAGEAGLGFAVVADEVRNLAQRSATAAKETARKIEEALRKSDEGVAVSQKVARHVTEVQAKATSVEQNLQAISEKVRQVDSVLSQISSASNEQTQGVKQINTAVSQLDKLTQNNAASAEESASASEQLSAQARTLDDTVSELRSLIGIQQGRDSGATAPTTAGKKAQPALIPAPPTALPQATSRRNETPAAPTVTHVGRGDQAEALLPMGSPGESSGSGSPPAARDFRDF